MQKLRLWSVIAAVALVLVVILQNLGFVQTRVLFVSVSMPHAVLLAVVFGTGYMAGLMGAGRVTRRGK